MIHQETDILIIGGGLIGAALMLALNNLGYRTLLVEAKPFAEEPLDFDARSLALAPSSQRILQNLGLWSGLQPFVTPIESIHVSEAGRFGATRLESGPEESLGYVVEIQHLQAAFHHALAAKQILAPAKLIALDKEEHLASVSTAEGDILVKARLTVAADGANSFARQLCALPVKIKPYKQTAIVANIGLTRSHQQQAFERFTTEGPLAFLPLTQNRMALVWTIPDARVNTLLRMSDKQFLSTLQEKFGYRLGRFEKIGQRFSYPLQQLLMPVQSAWPLVFIGNAAHTLHPVAGQGFNLSLRDIATLVQCIKEEGLSARMLITYEQRRKQDQGIISYFTDSLVELFISRIPGIALARNAGLMILDNIPLFKDILTHYAGGFGGYTPDLVSANPPKRGGYESF